MPSLIQGTHADGLVLCTKRLSVLLQVTCQCDDCADGNIMSPSAFEAHCGAASNRNWRVSLHHAVEKRKIGQWLEARGFSKNKRRERGAKSNRATSLSEFGDFQQPPEALRSARPHAGLGNSDLASSAPADEEVQPSEAIPTQVDVTCRGTPGILNLKTWEVR